MFILILICVRNNTTINAGKHTITSDKGVIINDPTAASYTNFKNLTINGGIWKNSSSSGLAGTMMRISYASNISINNATVYTNYKGHGIELISCSNVVVNNCTLKAQGKCSKTCVEEQLQIDLSSPTTAPGLYRLSKKLCNGTPCKNITVKTVRFRVPAVFVLTLQAQAMKLSTVKPEIIIPISPLKIVTLLESRQKLLLFSIQKVPQ